MSIVSAPSCSSRCLRIHLSPVLLWLCLFPFTARCPCKYGMILKVFALFGISRLHWTLDWSSLCDYALIISDLPVLRLHADLKPLQLNYVGDINTQGAKLTAVKCDGTLFAHFMGEVQQHLTYKCSKSLNLLYFPFLPHISANKFCPDPRAVILNQYSHLIFIFMINCIRCKSASDIKKVWMKEEEFCGWYFYTWMNWKQWLTMTSLIGVCRREWVSFMNQPYSILYSNLPDLKK